MALATRAAAAPVARLLIDPTFAYLCAQGLQAAQAFYNAGLYGGVQLPYGFAGMAPPQDPSADQAQGIAAGHEQPTASAAQVRVVNVLLLLHVHPSRA